jgi:SecD-like export protein
MNSRVRVAIAATTVAIALSGCGAASGAPPRPQPSAAGRLVITTWVADPVIAGGPYPGFRPRMTALTPDMLTNVAAEPDPNDPSRWDLTFTLTAAGASLFRQLSTSAYNACADGPGACPESHITYWLDLTQADIDSWNASADSLYRPYDGGGKLMTDPYVLSPINGGVVMIGARFSQRQAAALARQLRP